MYSKICLLIYHPLVQQKAVVKKTGGLSTQGHTCESRTCPRKSRYGINIFPRQTNLIWLILEKKPSFSGIDFSLRLFSQKAKVEVCY